MLISEKTSVRVLSVNQVKSGVNKGRTVRVVGHVGMSNPPGSFSFLFFPDWSEPEGLLLVEGKSDEDVAKERLFLRCW